MATTTPQLVLRKPAGSDNVNVTTDISDNMDKLDAASQKVLGYAQVTANQGSITAETDLVGLSVTVTVGTSRRIQITAHAYPLSSVGGESTSVWIKEGVTQLNVIDRTLPTAGRGDTFEGSVVLTPSASSHTYKLTIGRTPATGSSGTITNNAGATFPSFILVEDIGPA